MPGVSSGYYREIVIRCRFAIFLKIENFHLTFFRRPSESTDRRLTCDELYLCDSGAQFRLSSSPRIASNCKRLIHDIMPSFHPGIVYVAFQSAWFYSQGRHN